MYWGELLDLLLNLKLDFQVNVDNVKNLLAVEVQKPNFI